MMRSSFPLAPAKAGVQRPISGRRRWIPAFAGMTRVIGLGALLSLSACGLRPVYSGGSQGAVAQALQGISVTPIEGGKSGWLMQNALSDRLGSGSGGKYRLDIVLDDKIEGFGVRSDDAVTRERRTLRARYQLVDNGTGKTMLDATAGSDVGIDVVSSEYATIAAENSALERLAGIVADQIVSRVALTIEKNPAR
jgi:LPS-assembly lipoprotein